MIPAAFDYRRAASVGEALGLLAEHDDAKLLAGGHSLIPMMKLRLAAPSLLVDISRIPGLAGIETREDRMTIGALTTHAALASNDTLRTQAPALWDAANQLGDPQVRNRGTIGGAAAHGDPSADYPAVLLALDATVTIAGEHGERSVAASDFFRGLFETALAEREMIVRFAFDAAPASAYLKYHHPASHYAVVGAAVALTMDGGTIGAARVALAGVGDAAFRAAPVERALAGVDPRDAPAVHAACAGAAAGVEVRADTFASAAYRSAMAEVFTARAIARAATR